MTWPFSWPLGEEKEMPKATPVQPERVKRGVVAPTNNPYSYDVRLDAELRTLLTAAALMGDVDTVMDCLKDSPKFRKLLCAEAERKVEEQRKALAAAEEEARKACHIGGEA